MSNNKIISAEHALGATEDGILGGVIWMILRWDLKNSWERSSVRIDDVTDELGNVLIDKDDVDIVAFQEALEAIFDFANWRV